MKAFIKNIASVFLAFLVLFSTMSFTIDMHYCGDTLVDLAVFNHAKTCGMEVEQSSSMDNSIIKKDCCNDEQITFNGQDEITISLDNLTFDQHLFVASFIYSYINLFEAFDKEIIPFKDYTPPLVDKDIQVLYQTFII
jgi:hypothetical protein